MPWLMQLMRRQSWCEDVTRLLYAHEAEVSVERRNQFTEPPPSYSLADCVLIYTAFQHKDTQWDNSLFLKVCSGRRSIDMAEQERQVKCLIAAFRGSEGSKDQEVWVKIPPSTIFVNAVNSKGKSTRTEAARRLSVFQGKPYHATHMSNRYRNNPLTDLTGPFVPGKGQSYFRVEFLANTKAHNYVLSRLRRVLNSMQTHAEERTNAADGTPGRCLATLEELVNKAATQKLICPTTKVPIFNEAGDGDTARSHPFQASPERPDDRLADYSMNTYFLSVLAANVSCAGAWGKPDWYFFEVVCGRSDTVVDCGMTTVPETYALKQPAAHRDLRELLRQGKLPPPLPAEDPPAKRSRVVEPSATPADAAPPAPAQAVASGPAVESPAAPAVDVAATVAATVVATPPPAGGPPVVVAPSPDERHKNARAALSQNRSESHALAIKTRDLENQLAELKAKMDRLDVEKPALECELKAAAKAAGRTHGAMDAFLGKRKAD